MKYTVRHVRKLMEQGTIDPELWAQHFPSVLPSRVPTCDDCEDRKNNACEGGKNPVDCLSEKTTGAGQQPGTTGKDTPAEKKSGRFRWAGTGKDATVPPGANKTYDQSKM